jgi:hypothetical protein
MLDVSTELFVTNTAQMVYDINGIILGEGMPFEAEVLNSVIEAVICPSRYLPGLSRFCLALLIISSALTPAESG